MKEVRPGRMYIDIDEKIAIAKTQEEKNAWESQRETLERYSIVFCDSWYVDIYKQACGHWEILQSPIRPGETAASVRARLLEESSKRQCTKCICGW